jgi:hypothetical protein
MTDKEDIQLIAKKIKVFNNIFLSISQIFLSISEKHLISENSLKKKIRLK